MAQNNSGGSWENAQKPNNLGGMLVCPNCGQEVIGPFSATTAQNKIVKKWGCTSCSYVWKLEGGNFRTAFDANPVTLG